MASSTGSALLVVDVQKDFCHGGALAVPDGDRVVPVLNRYVERLAVHGLPVYASRDWHPAVSTHFKQYGGEWPPHCVAGSEGAGFHPDLRLPPSTVIITKGDEPDSQGYSAFEGKTSTGGSLLEDLRRRGIHHLLVGGLATDYCVKHSVLGALRAGLDVTVLTDAIAAVEVRPGDADRALKEMADAGADFADMEALNRRHPELQLR